MTKLNADTIDLKSSPILNLKSEHANILENSYASEETLHFRGQKPFSQLLAELGNIQKQFT